MAPETPRFFNKNFNKKLLKMTENPRNFLLPCINFDRFYINWWSKVWRGHCWECSKTRVLAILDYILQYYSNQMMRMQSMHQMHDWCPTYASHITWYSEHYIWLTQRREKKNGTAARLSLKTAQKATTKAAKSTSKADAKTGNFAILQRVHVEGTHKHWKEKTCHSNQCRTTILENCIPLVRLNE
jgi:hypothetical protein